MNTKFLRRTEAAEYLKMRYGHGSPKTLAKLAVIGGGPAFRKIGRIVVYEPAALDEWALSRMSAPIHSTSEAA
ncbi:MAG: hypothetical protein U1E20_06205 [Methylocystis sp.]|uniref:hypothetical protein n=1 Tax=Methylocystis sp. TaxID=1911079 RepID=UPI003920E72C